MNELSLHGQFPSLPAFVSALKEVQRCRNTAERYRHPFFCLRSLVERDALPGVNLRIAVMQTKDVNLTRTVMSWLDKHGPFWEDRRYHGSDEYLEHMGEIVTDCGMGEAAFRLASEQASAMVSFQESTHCSTPLQVIWHRADDNSHDLHIPNFWMHTDLEAYLSDSESAPQSWIELIERARQRYQNLTFVASILDALRAEPFSSTIAERVLVLLGILDRLKSSFGEDSRFNAEGHQLLHDYFQGDRALFSDESETNRRVFARQMTFQTPTGEDIFCPYHGKISFRYYRVHHSWPVRADEPLYVAYIGPKITKG
ncbi:MAG: hypothetical protein HC828_07200 [Blastochloris sp.]|nr:hypothetical protein [Blastochloris sp.]